MTLNAKRTMASVLFSVVVVGVVAVAEKVTLPFGFTAGTPIKSAEINANFNAVKAAVDDNAGRIASIEGKTIVAPRVIKRVVEQKFPGQTKNETQVTNLVVPLGKMPTDGVLMVNLSIGTDFAAYPSAAVEGGVSATPVLNGVAGKEVAIFTDAFGVKPLFATESRRPFPVLAKANEEVSINVKIQTYPHCTGSRGGSTDCFLSVSALAQFMPGATLDEGP